MDYMMVRLSNTFGDGLRDYMRFNGNIGDWYKFVWDDHSVMYVVRDDKCFGGFAYHRLDGPSIITDSAVMFFVDDTHYEYTRLYCEAAGMSDEDTFMGC